MIKIALDAGHGMNTPGKRCLKSIDKNETREWWLNNRVANYVEEFLKVYEGYEILRVDDRTGKVDVSRRTRTDKANNWKATIYISIHHNAAINGGSGGGVTVYRYPNSILFTKAMQKRLYDLMIKHTGLKGNRSNPLPESKFDVITWTKMPAVLIEGGYMDSTTDTPIILTDKFARQYASAIVEFLVTEYKLNKKPAPKPVEPTGDLYWRVIAGSFTEKKYAEEQKKLLESLGVKGVFLLPFNKE